MKLHYVYQCGKCPNECDPSIKRYFSINHKKLHDILNARRNFLKLCPIRKKAIDSLVDTLVNVIGKRNTKELNLVVVS